jgi:hypothetical protein
LSDLTCSLKITGSNFKPVTPPPAASVIPTAAKGM